MKKIETQITIFASAECVWSVLTSIQDYNHWNPLVTWGEGEPKKNSRLRLRIEQRGLATRILDVVILAFEPQRELRWIGRFFIPGLLDGEHSFVIEKISEKEVKLIHSEKFTGIFVPLLSPILIPRLTEGFLALNKALKNRAESFAVNEK